MATLKRSRAVQYLLTQEFVFNLAADSCLDITPALKAFKAAGGGAWDVIGLPACVLVGGEVVVETASNDTNATHTIAVGDSALATRYLAATSIKAAARTPLVPTGYRGTGEDLRITLAGGNGDATAGKVTVRAQYLIPGRALEVQPN
jgi:hypothetical protein